MKKEDENMDNIIYILFIFNKQIEELEGDINRLKKIINKSLKLIKLNL